MGHEHADLKLCILTHRHGDHTGGLKKLKKTIKFEVMAHEFDMPAIHQATGYDVEHVIKGGETLPDCGGIHVIHTPGHTAGHISLHLPRVKTMIAGDAIVSAGEHLMVSPTYLSSDPEAAHESVKRLIAMNLDLERLLVGHGDDVYFGAKDNMARIFAGPRPQLGKSTDENQSDKRRSRRHLGFIFASAAGVWRRSTQENSHRIQSSRRVARTIYDRATIRLLS